MTTDIAKQSLDKLQDKYADLLNYCQNIQISNVTEQKRIEELNAEVKNARTAAVTQLNYLIEPSREAITRTRELFKPYIDRLDAIISQISKSLDGWRKEQLAVTEDVVLQRADDYWQKRKEAAKTGEIVPLPDLAVTTPPKTSHHNLGATNYRTYVTVKIIKPNLIPREYCTPTESLLRKAGELALAQGNPLPDIEGAVLEIKYTPVNIRPR